MRILSVILLVLLMAACNGPSESPQAMPDAVSPPSSSQRVDEAPVAVVPEAGGAIQVVGTSLHLNFVHKVVYNRTSEPKPGVVQRQIFVQAFSASPGEVEADVVKALADAGFSVARQAPSSGGKRFDFRDSSGRKVSVLIRASLSAKKDKENPPGIAQFTFRD